MAVEPFTLDRDYVTDLEWFGSDDEWSFVENTYYGRTRWGVLYRYVLKDKYGQHWAGIIEDGATEEQEVEDEPVEFVPVKPINVTVTEYVEIGGVPNV